MPIPSTYGLSGFVRCLNTAGKFALLATAVVDADAARDVPIGVRRRRFGESSDGSDAPKDGADAEETRCCKKSIESVLY